MIPEKKSTNAPDETRVAGRGTSQVVNLKEGSVMLATFQPGWRWSEDVKPIVGTDSCKVAHFGYVVSGRMGARMDDGTEVEVGSGDVMTLPAGHDAWILGSEPCVLLDWSGAANYARPAS